MQRNSLWFVVLVTLFAGSGHAQTNTLPTSGNVGIGTLSPANKIEIHGDYNGQSDGWAADGSQGQLTVHGLSNPNLAFGIGVDTSNQVIRLQGQVIGSGALPIALNPMGGGRVGIGTASPLHFLEVVGDYNGGNDGWAADGGAGQFTIHGAANPNLAFGIGLDTTTNAVRLQGQIIGSGPLPILLNPMAGNVGIGTTSPDAKLDVNGSVKISGSGASMTFPDSTVQSTAWNGTTCGGDYAESVDVVGNRKAYEPGDVLVIDRTASDKFSHSTTPYSRLVAGIYSTKPGLTGRRQGRTVTGEEAPMAMLGIVPTKVSAENGAIDVGDLLVSSGTEGYAMKGTDASKMMGAVIGKAMAKLDTGKGVIEVLVSLQ